MTALRRIYFIMAMAALLAVVITLAVFLNSAKAEDQKLGFKEPAAVTIDFDQATCEAIKYKTLPTGQRMSAPVVSPEGIEAADAFSCTTDYPLMSKRLSTYGKINQNRDGSREFDTSQEKDLTAAGRELNKELMLIQIGRLLAISQAPVGYNSVLIVLPYNQVPIDDALLNPIRAAFSKAAKIDAAAQ